MTHCFDVALRTGATICCRMRDRWVKQRWKVESTMCFYLMGYLGCFEVGLYEICVISWCINHRGARSVWPFCSETSRRTDTGAKPSATTEEGTLPGDLSNTYVSVSVHYLEHFQCFMSPSESPSELR